MKIYLLGLGVLTLAIAANSLAKALNLTTWFDFLQNVSKNGLAKEFSSLSLFSIIWLFILYPLILGFSAYYFYKKLF